MSAQSLPTPGTFTLTEEASKRAVERWTLVRDAFLSKATEKVVAAFMDLGEASARCRGCFVVYNIKGWLEQKRRAALNAIARGDVDLNLTSDSALHKQGDLTLYTLVRTRACIQLFQYF